MKYLYLYTSLSISTVSSIYLDMYISACIYTNRYIESGSIFGIFYTKNHPAFKETAEVYVQASCNGQGQAGRKGNPRNLAAAVFFWGLTSHHFVFVTQNGSYNSRISPGKFKAPFILLR